MGAPAPRDPELRLPPFNWSIWFVWFGWSRNYVNQRDQINEADEIDQTNWNAEVVNENAPRIRRDADARIRH